jgi:regulator of protease activity HflC (stomatin/prohibitin superfamily)
MPVLIVVLVVFGGFIGLGWLNSALQRIVIFEYQRGVKYVNGKMVAILTPGRYRVWRKRTYVHIVDMRSQFTTVPGQEVLTSDGVPVKISLAVEYAVENPKQVFEGSVNFATALYQVLQVELRNVIAAEKVEALLENRSTFAAKLKENASPKVAAFGLKLVSCDVKDLMLSNELKKAFAQVLKAQKDGVAALERARGETAALRSLANAAKMTEDNPNLLQLRALQVISESKGNSIVLGVNSNLSSGSIKVKDTSEEP